jgi:hypothetical protein
MITVAATVYNFGAWVTVMRGGFPSITAFFPLSEYIEMLHSMRDLGYIVLMDEERFPGCKFQAFRLLLGLQNCQVVSQN